MSKKEILLDIIKRALGDRLNHLEKKNHEEENSLKLIKTSYDGFSKKISGLIKLREQKIAKDKLEEEKKLKAKHDEEARKAKQKRPTSKAGRKSNLNSTANKNKISDKKNTFQKTKSTANLNKKPIGRSRGKSVSRLNTEGGDSNRNTTGTNNIKKKNNINKKEVHGSKRNNSIGVVKKTLRTSKSMGKLLNKPTLKKAGKEEDDNKKKEIEEMQKMLNNIKIQNKEPEMEIVEKGEDKKEEDKKDELKIELPPQTPPTLMSCYQKGILEKSIIQFLTIKEQIMLFSCNKTFSSLTLGILKDKLTLYKKVCDIFIGQTIDDKINTLQAKYSQEELNAPIKNFELSRGCSKALGLLDDELYLRVFNRPVAEKTLEEIIIVYRLFCQLINKDDLLEIKDDKIFWEKFSKFILDNKGDKLSDFCVKCTLKFNFNNKNILKLKEMAKDNSEKLKPAYFGKICGTTGLFVFLVKDTLEYCGAIEDKKTQASRIKSNYLYEKTLFEGLNKYISFLEGLGSKKEENKIELEKNEEKKNIEEIKEINEIKEVKDSDDTKENNIV